MKHGQDRLSNIKRIAARFNTIICENCKKNWGLTVLQSEDAMKK